MPGRIQGVILRKGWLNRQFARIERDARTWPDWMCREVKMPGRKLIRNAARCMKCSAVVESRHTHDFVWCDCRALAVDGGVEYVKWVFDDINLVEDLCEYEEV